MAIVSIDAKMKQEFGQPVPDFSLPLLNSNDNRRLGDYIAAKKGAVIVFWSSVCTHCLRYDSYFNSFTQSHPQLGFVAIASRVGETSEQIRGSVRQRRLQFPILVDQGAYVARQWHSQQTPRCYLINTDRQLLYRGAVDNFRLPTEREYVAYLEPAIKSFVAGEPISKAEAASFGCAIESVYYELPKHLGFRKP